MKISVITPSYNQGIFIEDAIQCVIQQNYPNFEHIIIDGGSTDDTVDRIKKYPHLIWVSEKDDGQSDALNKGFRKASGDVIAWLNCDDLYLPGVFEKVCAALTSSDMDGVYGNVFICDKNKIVKKYKRSHRPYKFFLVFHGYIPSETLFVRRIIIENNILVDRDFHISMDKEFVAHILYKNFKLKHIDEPFAYFRLHENNKSLNTRKVQLQIAEEGLTILNRYWGVNIPKNMVTIRLYRAISRGLLPIRKLFKVAFK